MRSRVLDVFSLFASAPAEDAFDRNRHTFLALSARPSCEYIRVGQGVWHRRLARSAHPSPAGASELSSASLTPSHPRPRRLTDTHSRDVRRVAATPLGTLTALSSSVVSPGAAVRGDERRSAALRFPPAGVCALMLCCESIAERIT